MGFGKGRELNKSGRKKRKKWKEKISFLGVSRLGTVN